MSRIIYFITVAFCACVILGCDNTGSISVVPELPIQVTGRASLLTGFFGTPSKVLIFTNLSDSHLSCTLKVTAADGNSQREWVFDLKPHQQNYEIGVLETDWRFESGESITISAKGYRSISKTVDEISRAVTIIQ